MSRWTEASGYLLIDFFGAREVGGFNRGGKGGSGSSPIALVFANISLVGSLNESDAWNPSIAKSNSARKV